MGIGHFLYIEHTGTVVLPWWGGGKRPQVKNPWVDHLNLNKSNAIFNTILQKVYQFLRLFTTILYEYVN